MDTVEEPGKLSTILNRFRSTYNRITGPSENGKEEVQKPVEDQPVVEPTEQEIVRGEGLSALPQPEQLPEDASGSNSHTLEWPVVPEFVDPATTQPFEELGVSSFLCERLKEMQCSEAFAVQTAVIPQVLKSHRSLRPDPPQPVLVNSFTGSGKTLAYCVPIVDALHTRRIPRTRALILLPTKVLINQVHQVLEQLSKGSGLRIMSLRPERTLSKESALLSNFTPDILVCAPGRLMEHLNLSPKLLADLQFLVVDEADRLVGQNFQNWQDVLATTYLPPMGHPPRQNQMWHRQVMRLIFSATLTRDPSKLASLQINSLPAPELPKLFVVGQQHLDGKDEFSLPSQLSEKVIKVSSLGDKPLALTHELVANCQGRCLVFVRSNEAAARLARLVELVSYKVFGQLVAAKRCSGEMRVQDRRKVLRDFATEDDGVLVCTDLIARGIDMHIDYVINYDVPLGAREYVHRVGRTARAGNSGNAITIVSPGNDTKHFWDIQPSIARSGELNEEDAHLEVDEGKYQEALSELGQEVHAH